MRPFLLPLIISICSNSFAQTDATTIEIEKAYERYQKSYASIRPRLLFPHHTFIAGDSVRMAVLLLNEQSQLFETSLLMSLRVTNSTGQDILHQPVVLEGGVATLAFHLPDNLDIGFYRVSLCSESVGAIRSGSRLISVVNEYGIRPIVPKRSRFAIEGGSFISDQITHLYGAFTAVHSPVQILDEKGDVIACDTTDVMGFAKFEIAWNESKTYYSVCRGQKERVTVNTFQQGRSTGISISRQSPKTFLVQHDSSSSLHQDLFAVLISSGQLIQITKLKESSLTTVTLSRDLKPGVGQLTIINSQGFVFAHYGFLTDIPSIQEITIHWEKNEKNERVIKLLPSNYSRELQEVEIISIVNTSIVHEQDRPTQFDEVYGFAESCNQWPALTEDERDETWQRYLALYDQPLNWSSMLSSQLTTSAIGISKCFEWRGTVFLDSAKTQIAPRGMPIAFIHETLYFFFQTTVQHNGAVALSVPGSTIKSFVFFKGMQNGKRCDVWIEWEKIALPSITPPYGFEPVYEPNPYYQFQKQKRYVNIAYGTEENRIDVTDIKSSASQRLWEPDITIKTKDYTSFSTLEDLVKEVVPRLFLRQGKKQTVIRISLDQPMISDDSPLFVINGHITTSIHAFLSLSVKEIETISIIKSPKKLIPLGILGRQGVVLVSTSKFIPVSGQSNEHRPVPSVKIPSQGGILLKPITGRFPFFSVLPVWQVFRKPNRILSETIFLLGHDPAMFRAEVLSITEKKLNFYSTEFRNGVQ